MTFNINKNKKKRVIVAIKTKWAYGINSTKKTGIGGWVYLSTNSVDYRTLNHTIE